MSNYRAPLREMRFVIHELIGSASICALPSHQKCDTELIDAILEQASHFAGEVLSPLNPVGDKEGACWRKGKDGSGEVKTPTGFTDAYRLFVEAGWMALPSPPRYGGQGLPRLLAVAVNEMWKSANLSFSHVITLTHGAIEALMIAGSDQMKALWLPRLISGEWTGTMNITEPQAGSDLSAIACRAVPEIDGSYRIFGQKIFITYGEHDMAANIVHLVLARTPGAPAGIKGLSLFLVPKYLVSADGTIGTHNDVYCTSIEHKLGVRGSPTTTLVHGDHGGSTGYLIGELGRGLETMFIMMNSARLSVGTEGLAVAQRAYQMATAYAKQRIQGTDAIRHSKERVVIIRHPDIRRQLMSQRCQIEAVRALAYTIAAMQDIAHHAPNHQEREIAQRKIELLTPVLKGWSTESAVELTSNAIQIFGGTGYVEETGIAQYLRDARITSIYEGTTAIHAADLAGRKIARDGGQCLTAIVGEMRTTETALIASTNPALNIIGIRLGESVCQLEAASQMLLKKMNEQPGEGLAVAEPFLKLFGITAGGWQMGKAALVAARAISGSTEYSFYKAKIISSKFFADHILPRTAGLLTTVQSSNALLLEMDDDTF